MNKTFNITQDNAFMLNLFQKYNTTDPNLIWLKKLSHSHCSALVKLIRDEDHKIKDVFIGHTTWDDYSAMLRIFKNYEFEFLGSESVLRPHTLEFPSYPGIISSTDDYYIINTKFVVMETTLEILDERVQSKILTADEYVPDFFRLLAANRLATSGKNWIHWLGYVNSGTYNSMWMVLDLEKFGQSIGQTSLLVDTFDIAEQSPGFIMSDDKSETLSNNGYFASYNVPSFNRIR